MTIAEPVRAPLEDARVNYVQWGPAIAGALIATAVALVLDSFGAAIGLAVTSTAPTWRDSSAALQLLSGLYLILVAIAAFGAGGYLAGRMRRPVPGNPDEVEFRDGTLGLVAWAIAVILTVLDDLGCGAILLAARRACERDAVRRWRKSDRLRSRPTVPRGATTPEHQYRICPVRSGAHSADQCRTYRGHDGRPQLSCHAHLRRDGLGTAGR